MRRIFADAVFWVAVANRKDQWYAKVVTVIRSLGQATLVTTEEVLDEFLAHYSGHGPVLRNLAVATVEKALSNPLAIVRLQSHQSFLAKASAENRTNELDESILASLPVRD